MQRTNRSDAKQREEAGGRNYDPGVQSDQPAERGRQRLLAAQTGQARGREFAEAQRRAFEAWFAAGAEAPSRWIWSRQLGLVEN
ncbi:MAG: hypothetical protein H6841_02590 [Planctomycetes bacterium]|nr:hypothetical protein [Planctomycetota bacterium]